MATKDLIQETLCDYLNNKFQLKLSISELVLNETRKEFEGHYTLVCFPLTRQLKKSPDIIAKEIGEALVKDLELIDKFNTVKGFLNLTISEKVWKSSLQEWEADKVKKQAPQTIVVEYSSPNTNKPLHLGHIRNNLLGYSVCNILIEAGHRVIKTNITNDRGIHICKSMLAWEKFGNGENPENSKLKGDHLVGKYYVKFDQEYKKQINQLIAEGKSEKEASENAPILNEARELLIKWENKDPETISNWKMMNQWVYDGFEKTYKRMGIDFDKIYYESDTYLVGKDIVNDGLNNRYCFKKDDGSVWVDLGAHKLDEKILLRSDGTSVYITQDIGTAQLRYDDYKMDRSVYVVGNEQDYHFKALKAILKEFKKDWSDGIYHLSYGMVDLPSGKMKSREGTVVDADDLLQEMHDTAKEQTLKLGKIDSFSETEANELYEMIGLGAVKFYLLKVDPKKNILFNPEDSIDFQGFTGPFIQYTHARIQSMLRKHGKINYDINKAVLDESEIDILILLNKYSEVLHDAADEMNPALIANYAFELSKNFNRYYAKQPILAEKDINTRNLRIELCQKTASALTKTMGLLGITLPDRM